MSNKEGMTLKILLPFGIFAIESGVLRMVVDTSVGSLGILPHRMDCVAALVPGILEYQIGEAQESYLAMDEGILIKTGLDVFLSVRNAVGGKDLESLKDTVEQEFLVLNEGEQKIRRVISKMESAFIRQIAAFTHG